jgi:hypothetical protein
MIGQSCEHVGKPCLRINIIELAGLCRSPNNAERACFPQDAR